MNTVIVIPRCPIPKPAVVAIASPMHSMKNLHTTTQCLWTCVKHTQLWEWYVVCNAKPVVQQHQSLTVSYVNGEFTRPVLEPNESYQYAAEADAISCSTCHKRQNSILVSSATIEAETHSFHEYMHSPELSSEKVCSSCHQFTLPNESIPLYNTVNEWKKSPQAASGIGCQDCHYQVQPVGGQQHVDHSLHTFPSAGLTMRPAFPR